MKLSEVDLTPREPIGTFSMWTRDIVVQAVGKERAQKFVIEWGYAHDLLRDMHEFVVRISDDASGVGYTSYVEIGGEDYARTLDDEGYVVNRVLEVVNALAWRFHRPKFRIRTR